LPTNQGDIPERIAARIKTFPWRFKAHHPELEAVQREALLFAADVLAGRPKRWLSLLGPSGIGKTLTNTDLLCFLERHWTRIITRCHEDGSTSGRTPQIAHIIPARDLDTYTAARDYAAFDLVYVEDIGAGQFGEKGAGAVVKSRLAELLQLRTGKWTLLDANLHRGEIAEQLDTRIASRLRRDGSVCLEISDAVPDFNG
jgi:hypothetical protein